MTASFLTGIATVGDAALAELELGAAVVAAEALLVAAEVGTGVSLAVAPGPVAGTSKAARPTGAVCAGAVLATACGMRFFSERGVVLWALHASGAPNPQIATPNKMTILELICMRV